MKTLTHLLILLTLLLSLPCQARQIIADQISMPLASEFELISQASKKLPNTPNGTVTAVNYKYSSANSEYALNIMLFKKIAEDPITEQDLKQITADFTNGILRRAGFDAPENFNAFLAKYSKQQSINGKQFQLLKFSEAPSAIAIYAYRYAATNVLLFSVSANDSDKQRLQTTMASLEKEISQFQFTDPQKF